VINEGKPENFLDTYQRLRRPAALEVLGLTARLTGMATIQSAMKRQIRNTALSMVNYLPPAKRRLLMNLSGLSRKALSVI